MQYTFSALPTPLSPRLSILHFSTATLLVDIPIHVSPRLVPTTPSCITEGHGLSKQDFTSHSLEIHYGALRRHYGSLLRSVDAVLISSYEGATGLTFLDSLGFFGEREAGREVDVYGTLPSQVFGSLCGNELRTWGFGVGCDGDSETGSMSGPESGSRSRSRCGSRYRYRGVSYGQRIVLAGGNCVVIGVPSGYAIGSCNWVIRAGGAHGQFESVLFLGTSCTAKHSHPKELLTQNLLAKLAGTTEEEIDSEFDVVVVMDEFSSSTLPSQSVAALWSRIVETFNGSSDRTATTTTITDQHGGSPGSLAYRRLQKHHAPCVIVPCSSCGVIFDILEFLDHNLQQSSNSLGDSEIFVISEAAQQCFNYAGGCGEWLHQDRFGKALRGENPFKLRELANGGRLHVFPRVDQSCAMSMSRKRSSPTVFFVGHPSLLYGPVCRLLELFGGDSRNSLLLIDPRYPLVNVDEFRQKYQIRVYSQPIDVRLTANEIVKLCSEIIPVRNLIVSENLRNIIESLSQEREALSCSIQVYYEKSQPSIVNVPIKRKFAQARLTRDLADTVFPKRMKFCNVARVVGSIHRRDGMLELRPPPPSEVASKGEEHEEVGGGVLLGKITIQRIVRSLQLRGYVDVQVRVLNEGLGKYEVVIGELKASILFSPRKTMIRTPIERSRKILKKIVTENFFVL